MTSFRKGQPTYLDATANRWCTIVDGDSVVNKLLVLATGANALARTETPTENVKTNARNPNFIIFITVLPNYKQRGDKYVVIYSIECI